MFVWLDAFGMTSFQLAGYEFGCDGREFWAYRPGWGPLLEFEPGLPAFLFSLPALRLMYLYAVRRWRGDSRDFSGQGVCYRCGYDLKGTVEHRCPECGTINGRGDLIRGDD